jgi:transposase
MTGQLEALAEWLTAQQVMLVGMESTGIYWKPEAYSGTTHTSE